MVKKTKKTIDTLVDDIYNLLDGTNPLELPKELAEAFGERMAKLVSTRVGRKGAQAPTLRMSNLGRPCERQTWFNIHKPEEIEKLRPNTLLKFLYGDCIEELLLFLAEATGHRVEGMQDVLELEGVKGSRDCVIDGMLVDAKSASPFSFKKFADGTLAENDAFGYIGQIQSYLEASQDDPLVTIKDKCAFFVMDKVNGHICLDIHDKVPFDVREITRRKVAVMEDKETVPPRAFEAIPDGVSGNMKLDVNCSYCDAKHTCWPSLRVFAYSYGPRYLTVVKKEPNVPEIFKPSKEDEEYNNLLV